MVEGPAVAISAILFSCVTLDVMPLTEASRLGGTAVIATDAANTAIPITLRLIGSVVATEGTAPLSCCCKCD